MEGEHTDAELLALSRTRPEDFAGIFERHFSSISSYVRRRVRSDIAEELAAETFVIAFRQRSKFDPDRGTVKAWLFGIASNLLRHEWRRENRELRALSRTGVDPVAPEAERSDERVSASAQTRRLALALRRLGKRDRNVLLLFAWAELSYEEIAEALGIPVGTVRSSLSRSRAKVRELLDESGQEANGTFFTGRALP